MRVPLLVALAGLALQAQAPAAVPERRTIAVSVLDKEGRAVHGLTAENFRGEFRSQPVRILSATEDSSPRRIAIVADTSGSMAPHFQTVLAIVNQLLTELAPDHELALYTIAHEVKRHIPLTRDIDRNRPIRLETPSGGTPLYLGLMGVSKDFDPPKFGDTILLISDAVDTMSPRYRDECEEALSRQGLRVVILRIPATISSMASPALFPTMQPMKPIGGSTVMLPSTKPEDVSASLTALSEPLRNVYRLDLELNSPIDKPRNWKLEVLNSEGKKLKDSEIAYPRLLVPLAEKK